MTYDEPGGGSVDVLLKAKGLISVLSERIGILGVESSTLVTIVSHSGGRLAVGGDVTAGLIVYIADENDNFWQLVNPDAKGLGDIEVVAGGQPGVYPAHHLVDLELAVRAAEEYAMKGHLASELTWEANG